MLITSAALEEKMEEEIEKHTDKINRALGCMIADIKHTDPERYERAIEDLEKENNGKRGRERNPTET